MVGGNIIFNTDFLNDLGQFLRADIELGEEVLLLEDHLGELAELFVSITHTREVDILQVKEP